MRNHVYHIGKIVLPRCPKCWGSDAFWGFYPLGKLRGSSKWGASIQWFPRKRVDDHDCFGLAPKLREHFLKVTSSKLTWQWKITIFDRKITIFIHGEIFYCHVAFRECTTFEGNPPALRIREPNCTTWPERLAFASTSCIQVWGFSGHGQGCLKSKHLTMTIGIFHKII